MNNFTEGRVRSKLAVSRDADIHSGDLVFRGTRVPVETLIDHLQSGYTLEEYLDDFPSVERWQVKDFLTLAFQALGAMVGSGRRQA